jgi:hypothetical protein
VCNLFNSNFNDRSGIERSQFLAFCEKLLIPSKEGDYAGTGETLVPLSRCGPNSTYWTKFSKDSHEEYTFSWKSTNTSRALGS